MPSTPPESYTPSSQALPPRGRDRMLSMAPPPPIWRPATPAFVLPTRSSIWPWLVTLGVLALVAAITLPLAAGVYFGIQDRQAFLEKQAVEHFQRALAYESETYTELAMTELQVALQYKPDYDPARAKLNLLIATRTASKQVPNDVAIAEQLFSSAQAEIARQQWDAAIDLLEELRRTKADYRADQVTQYLVQAYLNAGRLAVAAGDIEAAQHRAEAVLRLAPTSGEARALRQNTIWYNNGVQAIGEDWPSAVITLQRLYDADPKFYNVKQQLRKAHLGYGDFASRQGAFCVAAREYEAARALEADPDVAARLVSANDSCKQAVLSPTPTPTPLPEGLLYIGALRVNESAVCEGIGGITGVVRDVDGQLLPGVSIKIYNDVDYAPPPVMSGEDGAYVILLGQDPGLFHLVVVNPEGMDASAALDIQYPGGTVPGCHTVVNWTKVQ